jgi:predicted AAA+ superfamily ATPase
MLRQEQISSVLDAQKESFLKAELKVKRDFLEQVPIAKSFVTIITGIRRCGKSTLLLQLLKKKYKDALYLNFEDIRLTGFETNDFIRLHQEVVSRKIKVLFFDEIQLVPSWEIFVHQLLNEGYTVFVTGSNASLLSREMGTHLTGRHLSMELFPFSYSEFLTYKKAKTNVVNSSRYLQDGGMPEFVISKQALILSNLIEDIIIRDIAIRYKIREVDTLKQLAIYLITNIGKPVSANKLNGLFGIKSTTTILEYFNYFRDCYLIDFVPQFSYSLKAQIRNPKKVYTIDNGFIDAVSASFTEDKGRKLENMVFMHLRRTKQEIFFYKDKNECDFVTFTKGKVNQLIQVCFEITDENFEREYQGLLNAMKFFDHKVGFIVTMNQKDEFQKDGFTVRMAPVWEFMGG